MGLETLAIPGPDAIAVPSGDQGRGALVQLHRDLARYE